MRIEKVDVCADFDKAEAPAIGDTVEVIDVGRTYSTYSTWRGLKGYEEHFVRGYTPVKKERYKVLKIAEHGIQKWVMLALIQNPDTERVYIIGTTGIKKVEE